MEFCVHVDFVKKFRFSHQEIDEMSRLLHLPRVIIAPSGIKIHHFYGLCLVLHHLSWPHRLHDAETIFPMSVSAMSELFNHILKLLYSQWKHVLHWDHVHLTPEFLNRCAQVVLAKGALLEDTFAFIDGTHMRICQPEQNQEDFYSGQKRYHSMKFQCITTPDAMLVHVGGPFLGWQHDAQMLNESRIRPYLLAHAHGPDGRQMSVYGDEGYGQSPKVKAPFRGNMLTPEQHQRNESM